MQNVLVVSKVEPDSQAEKVGIRIGDILVSYDGKPLSTDRDVSLAIGAAQADGKQQVSLETTRAGASVTHQVTTDRLGISCTEQQATTPAPAAGLRGKTDYGTARLVAGFVSMVGWLLVAGAAIAAAMAIGGGAAMESRYGAGLGGLSLIALLPAIGTAVSGFLLVMGAQATRAIVDTADHAREIRAFLGRTS